MRHPSYLDPSLADLLRQRIFQTASDYVDGNDANTLRRDPMFRVIRLFLRPYSLLLDYVDEPDKFQKVKIQLLDRLVKWVIQDGLFIGLVLQNIGFRCDDGDRSPRRLFFGNKAQAAPASRFLGGDSELLIIGNYGFASLTSIA